MQSHKLNALDRRKAQIVDRLKMTGGEIWAGDVANYADLEKWRPAFEALVNEGILTKRKTEKSRRIYYAFTATTDQLGERQPAHPRGPGKPDQKADHHGKPKTAAGSAIPDSEA